MALPESAAPYWQQQAAINAATVAIAARSWEVSGGNASKWRDTLPLLMGTITRAQARASILARKYVQDAVTDLDLPDDPAERIDPAQLIGVSGNGLPLHDLYERLPDQFALNLARGAERVYGDLDEGAPAELQPLSSDAATRLPSVVVRDAMAATSKQLQTHVRTTISDTGRAAESLEIAVRPQVGYVRMLNPPSCNRCVILAGKFHRWSTGFRRHENCDCRYVPARESIADDLRVDPDQYFASLSEAEQDKTFGKANAQSIRDGANMSQVVNAEQGTRVAQVYGRELRITTQGTTKRGYAGKVIRARGRNPATTPRLMPSSIYQIADDRADAIRLLRLNGYVMEDNTPGIVDLDALLARSTA